MKQKEIKWVKEGKKLKIIVVQEEHDSRWREHLRDLNKDDKGINKEVLKCLK